MLVPEEVRKCVAFIGYLDASGYPQLAGTAFFIASELDDLGVTGRGAVFLVTARHVVEGIEAKGGRGVVRVNVGGKAKWLQIPASSFVSHPSHPGIESVDVAVAAVSPPEEIDFMAIPTRMFATDERISKERIGLGDEVFVSGLFWNHHGKERNIPIVRIGNIAAMPEEKINSRFGDIEAYLVEARSIGGLSGSPVFVHLGLTRVVGGKVQFAQNTAHGVFYLLGLMQGHWDSNGPLSVDELPVDDSAHRERVNMGIAIVTPISKVLDTLQRSEMQSHRQQLADNARRSLESDLPTMDAIPEKDG